MSDDNKQVLCTMHPVKANEFHHQDEKDDRNCVLEIFFFAIMAGSFAAFSLAYWSGWNGKI